MRLHLRALSCLLGIGLSMVLSAHARAQCLESSAPRCTLERKLEGARPRYELVKIVHESADSQHVIAYVSTSLRDAMAQFSGLKSLGVCAADSSKPCSIGRRTEDDDSVSYEVFSLRPGLRGPERAVMYSSLDLKLAQGELARLRSQGVCATGNGVAPSGRSVARSCAAPLRASPAPCTIDLVSETEGRYAILGRGELLFQSHDFRSIKSRLRQLQRDGHCARP